MARTVFVTGVWAENATPTTSPIPAPIPGQSFRGSTPAQLEEGAPYDRNPVSEKVNEGLYQVSFMSNELDQYGSLEWSDLVDYKIDGTARGTDGILYIATVNTGPATANVQDPVGDVSGTWIVLSLDSSLRADLADNTIGSQGSLLVGYNSIAEGATTVRVGLDERPTFDRLDDTAAPTGASLVGTQLFGDGTTLTTQAFVERFVFSALYDVTTSSFFSNNNIDQVVEISPGVYEFQIDVDAVSGEYLPIATVFDARANEEFFVKIANRAVGSFIVDVRGSNGSNADCQSVFVFGYLPTPLI